MKRFKDFMRTKGLYLALGVGALALVGMMIAYNYDNYKHELGMDKQTIDLNAPSTEENRPQAIEAHIEPPKSTEATSNSVVADKTDGEDTEEQDANWDENSNEGKTFSDDAPSAEDANGLDERQELLAASTDPVIVDQEGVMVAKCYDGESPLVWPVSGEVLIPYSMDTTVYFKTLGCYRCNPAVLIAGQEGENVLACYEGVVDSITEDKEHGAMVTIDMGNGYKAVYGQLMNITVSEEQAVTTAQNIGEIAPVSNYYVKEGNHLYFQLLKDGEPVNPMIYMQ